MRLTGIRRQPYNSFSIYLNNKTQCVTEANCLSKEGQRSFGVSKGSVLFLIYINGLYEAKLNYKITVFADYTALSYKWDDRY